MSHSNSPGHPFTDSCFQCWRLRASSWNLKQTPLCPTPLVPDKGRASCSQGRGGRWAQGSQGLQTRIHPQRTHQAKKTEALQAVTVRLSPGQLHGLVSRKNLRNLPICTTPASCPRFPARGWHTAPHKVLICSFLYFQEILKMESQWLERTPSSPCLSLCQSFGTQRCDLTVSLQYKPFYVPSPPSIYRFLLPDKHSWLELCILNVPLG